MDLGVNVYLGKPYNETELAQIIKDLLAEVRPVALS
jgi:YesN/AraC family two-component response regulator